MSRLRHSAPHEATPPFIQLDEMYVVVLYTLDKHGQRWLYPSPPPSSQQYDVASTDQSRDNNVTVPRKFFLYF